jgi:hypothetical protein
MEAEDRPEWFSTDMCARDVVNRLLEEQGDSLELYFTNVKKMVKMLDKINEAHAAERCRLDPFFFLEHYKSELSCPDVYTMIAGLAEEEHAEYEHYICAHPECHYVRHEDGSADSYSIRKCRMCGFQTSVNSRVILEHGVMPDPVLMALAAHNYDTIKRSTLKGATMVKMAVDMEHIDVKLFDYRPALRISKEMPGLRADGDHFIRGRVNREVLTEAAATSWPSNDRDPGYVAGQDARPLTDLMMLWHATDMETVDMLMRIVNDPSTFLDPSKAAKFREEYVDSRWDEEFGTFVTALIDKNILTVDSSGVRDTLTTLYHLAQRKAGKKTVIRKNGKIKFPTHEVLENISPDLIKRAFAVTEHGSYSDPQQVFRLAEVAHE